MDDRQIIDLFWNRSENAILETQLKYGHYCHSISYNILHNDEDAKECVNDTLIKAWNAIPPNKPNCFKTFLAKIIRNLSLDRYEKYHAQKRGCGEIALALGELQECLPQTDSTSAVADELTLQDVLNTFLRSLPAETRKIFIRRYWYLSTIKEISSDYSIKESKVKMSLLRTRNQLRGILEKEGIKI